MAVEGAYIVFMGHHFSLLCYIFMQTLYPNNIKIKPFLFVFLIKRENHNQFKTLLFTFCLYFNQVINTPLVLNI